MKSQCNFDFHALNWKGCWAFSYSYWPFVHLLLTVHFEVFYFVLFCIVCSFDIIWTHPLSGFLPFCRFAPHSLSCVFCCVEAFDFMESHFLILHLISWAIGVLPRKPLLVTMPWRFPLYFFYYFKSFVCCSRILDTFWVLYWVKHRK